MRRRPSDPARRPLLFVHDPAFGGMGRAASFLLDACRADGIDARVLTLTTPGRSNVEQGRLTSAAATHALRLVWSLARVLARRRVSLVYVPIAQWGLPLARDTVFVALARAFRVPVVIHLHGSALAERLAHPRTRGDRAIRAVVRGERWAVLSDALRELLLSSGAATDVVVLRNPAETPSAGSVDRTGKALAVGFLGNCSRVKGLDLVVAGVARARDTVGVPIGLVVAGPRGDVDLPDHEWLDYRGPLHGERLEDFWNDVDVLMLPARRVEGLPFVILEGLQRHKLVFATPSLGLDELVREGAVALVEADQEACAGAVVRAARDLEHEAARQREAWTRIAHRYAPSALKRDWLAALNLS